MVFGPNNIKAYQSLKSSRVPITEWERLESYVISVESVYINKIQKKETVDQWVACLGRVSSHRLMLKGLPQSKYKQYLDVNMANTSIA